MENAGRELAYLHWLYPQFHPLPLSGNPLL
jgi:hypothetical protein